jgi:cellulose synthase/poly-beta-1,6-N-acetylglucosamine synthase-like glycosyltransferase/peptidoglycan/xylan/chitin deacetylase (PgdA/CDA1 family)/spore germination protein YaaH
MPQPETNRPVFYDPHGTRKQHVGWLAFALGGAATVLAVVFILSVLFQPLLPGLVRPAHVNSLPLPPLAPDVAVQKAKRAKLALDRAHAGLKPVPAKRPSQIHVTPPHVTPTIVKPTTQPLTIGFYVNWDDSSYESLRRHLGKFDEIVPEWLRLQDGADPLVPEIDARALDLIRRQRPQLPILPMLHNSKAGVWDAPALTHAVQDAPSRKRLVDALVACVGKNGFAGVVLDLETVPQETHANLLQFVKELHAAFAPHGWRVAQAVPFDDPEWDFPAYAAANDQLFLMAYDEHWSTSEAGSVASQPWFLATLAKRLAEIPAAKAVVCIGAYGYDFVAGQEATDLTFQAAVLAARDAQVPIVFDPATLNPHFAYAAPDGLRHDVWFLDAVTALNQMRAATAAGVAGFAIWRLGSEDPSLWGFLGTPPTEWKPDALRTITFGYEVDFEGAGEILDVVAQPQPGTRALDVSASATVVTDERYVVLPSSFVIHRSGQTPGKVALTFDDGPDPLWTPKILDTLKQQGVHATFFIIGENAIAHPDLMRRIVAEGHDIGNHTFTHPNLGEVPLLVANLELNATQRLVESLTGRSTRLFRPPYFGDAEPTIPAEVEPIVAAKNLGYLTIGLRVDGEDWAQPGVDAIVKNVVGGVLNPSEDVRGQIVLLHDSGGDRAQTVAALPLLIAQLKAKGQTFVTVSELAGLTRDQAMPPVPPHSLVEQADAVTVTVLSTGSWLLHWLFLIGIVLGVMRLLFVGALALVQWWRTRVKPDVAPGQEAPFLASILVPAYNEEKVINQTIESLLKSDYPRLEILVIDDGSSDRTSEVARERFGDHPNVRIFRKENGGKANALNFGMQHANGDVVVGLDADTLFMPNTIGLLVRHFSDPKVGAVAGNAKVGNRINLITSWQALEYITAQNLDRRAFALLDCITVVPGAVGAWRKEVIEKLGGFSDRTLAEDQDLTIRVLRAGWKVSYEEDAIAWTEAPDTVGGLAKQRFRWSFGTLQCLWKHRDVLFRRKYAALGLVAMPNVLIFQVFFPLISPIMDLMLVWSLITVALEKLEHPGEQGFANLGTVLVYYALFLTLDWLAAAFAFALERREQWRLLTWLFLQRFCYRQVMYYVMIRSVVAAMRGAMHGWGKLERKATATTQN